jgi:hypothetical protein
MISVLAEEIKGELEKCEGRRGRRPCSVAESSEEGGSGKDGKAQDKGRKELTAIPFLPSAAMPYGNCCQVSSVALNLPMST